MLKLKFLFALSFIFTLTACGGGDGISNVNSEEPVFSVTVIGD